MLWWEKYVGIPFKAMGRDESGVDCVGLGILMMRREKGVTVDDTALTYTAAEMRHFRSLHRIDALIQSGLSQWHDIGDDTPRPPRSRSLHGAWHRVPRRHGHRYGTRAPRGGASLRACGPAPHPGLRPHEDPQTCKPDVICRPFRTAKFIP